VKALCGRQPNGTPFVRTVKSSSGSRHYTCRTQLWLFYTSSGLQRSSKTSSRDRTHDTQAVNDWDDLRKRYRVFFADTRARTLYVRRAGRRIPDDSSRDVANAYGCASTSLLPAPGGYPPPLSGPICLQWLSGCQMASLRPTVPAACGASHRGLHPRGGFGWWAYGCAAPACSSREAGELHSCGVSRLQYLSLR
jgi:hypothetical protein